MKCPGSEVGRSKRCRWTLKPLKLVTTVDPVRFYVIRCCRTDTGRASPISSSSRTKSGNPRQPDSHSACPSCYVTAQGHSVRVGGAAWH